MKAKYFYIDICITNKNNNCDIVRLHSKPFTSKARANKWLQDIDIDIDNEDYAISIDYITEYDDGDFDVN